MTADDLPARTEGVINNMALTARVRTQFGENLFTAQCWVFRKDCLNSHIIPMLL